MPLGSRIELVTALAKLDYSSIIDTPETAWLDFKSAPYQLDQPGQRWELAKDVAAFANKGGGMIVLGVKTRRHQLDTNEVAASVNPISKELIAADAYRSVIRDWIYPSVSEIDLKWFPPEITETRGLFLIDVPSQNMSDQLFVVRKHHEGGSSLPGALGIPIRDGADIYWLSAETLHARMQRGYREAQRQSGHPDALGMITLPSDRTRRQAPLPRMEGVDKLASRRLRQLQIMQGWEEEAVYGLAALPPESAGGLPNFHNRGGIAEVLRDPPSLRGAGFNLRVFGERQVIDGGVIYGGRRAIVWLEPSGVITAAGVGNRSWLGWAINDLRPTEGPTWINAIPLVEFTVEFFRFVDDQLRPTIPGDWDAVVSCERFQQSNLHLEAGQAGFGPREPNPASTDEWTRPFPLEGDAGKDAFQALSSVYMLFGLGSDAIPYSRDGRVLEEELRRL